MVLSFASALFQALVAVALVGIARRAVECDCGATTSTRSRAGVKAVFNVTAMERSILAELFELGGRGQLSVLRDRRPIERLVNKGFVERHTLNS